MHICHDAQSVVTRFCLQPFNLVINHQWQSLHLDEVAYAFGNNEKKNELSTSKHLWLEFFFSIY
jgi:hypothetical protein